MLCLLYSLSNRSKTKVGWLVDNQCSVSLSLLFLLLPVVLLAALSVSTVPTVSAVCPTVHCSVRLHRPPVPHIPKCICPPSAVSRPPTAQSASIVRLLHIFPPTCSGAHWALLSHCSGIFGQSSECFRGERRGYEELLVTLVNVCHQWKLSHRFFSSLKIFAKLQVAFCQELFQSKCSRWNVLYIWQYLETEHGRCNQTLDRHICPCFALIVTPSGIFVTEYQYLWIFVTKYQSFVSEKGKRWDGMATE